MPRNVLVAVGRLPADITVSQFIELIDAVNAGAPPPAGTFEAGAVFSKPAQYHQKLFDNTVRAMLLLLPDCRSQRHTAHREGFVGGIRVCAARAGRNVRR